MICYVVIGCVMYVFFFFKQKTAYEMRISEWSSDVCSSDLAAGREIRCLDVLHELVNGNVPVINVGNGGIYHFGEVVRRHVGSHSHGNAGSAVHKQGGYSGWKYGGFFQ